MYLDLVVGAARPVGADFRRCLNPFRLYLFRGALLIQDASGSYARATVPRARTGRGGFSASRGDPTRRCCNLIACSEPVFTTDRDGIQRAPPVARPMREVLEDHGARSTHRCSRMGSLYIVHHTEDVTESVRRAGRAEQQKPAKERKSSAGEPFANVLQTSSWDGFADSHVLKMIALRIL